MTRRQLRMAEWALLFGGIVPLIGGVAAFTRRQPVIAILPASGTSPSRATGEGHLADSLLRGVVEVAPFRLIRRPAAAAYQVGGTDVAADAPVTQRPVLSLSGIIAGRHPAALLDGVPGRTGSVLLQLGDTVAGLRLRRVGLDRVIVTGMDTTWTLTLRQPWTQ